MSQERELLRRALDALDDRAYTPEWYQAKQDIRAYLAAEPEAEPVRNNAFDDEICPVCGYYCNGKGGFGCIDKPVLTGLRKTPRPSPSRKPMTEEEIENLYDKAGHHDFDLVMRPVVEFARAVEKHHGIGGDDE